MTTRRLCCVTLALSACLAGCSTSEGPLPQRLVDVNLLLTSMMGGQTRNAYDIVQQAGVLLQAAGGPIPVLKWGEGPDDDQSPVGCLTLRSGKRDAIRVIHFGQIGRDDRLRQSAVDARYRMHLTEAL